jgi:hypothetical protein
LCLWASKAALARPASSGAAASTSLQLDMHRVYFSGMTALDNSGGMADCVAVAFTGAR